MIEINLRPGSEGRAKRKGGGLKLPVLPGLPKMDRWTGAMVAAWILAPALLVWLYLGTEARTAELSTSLEVAEQDSARYARIIQTTSTLQARRDTIAEKLQIIQQIDAGRYVWAHLMDEVSRALPEYTWLTALEQVAAGPQPGFRISGRTGTMFALTRYLESLESSPFVQGVSLEGTRQVEEEGRRLYEFTIGARYEEPPPELVETTPLFEMEEEAQAVTDSEG